MTPLLPGLRIYLKWERIEPVILELDPPKSKGRKRVDQRTLACRNSSTPAYSRALCAAKSTKILPREPPAKESYRCYPTKD